jgi:hypothetical protein
VLREQGHEVPLMPAQYVNPYAQTNKSDYLDAEAVHICDSLARRTRESATDKLVLSGLSLVRLTQQGFVRGFNLVEVPFSNKHKAPWRRCHLESSPIGQLYLEHCARWNTENRELLAVNNLCTAR